MTYREAILLGESILQKAKIVDAKNDAWLLLAMACRIDHTYYYVHMDAHRLRLCLTGRNGRRKTMCVHIERRIEGIYDI